MAFLNQTKNRLIAIATLSVFACAAAIAVLRFAPPSRLEQKGAETACQGTCVIGHGPWECGDLLGLLFFPGAPNEMRHS